MPEEVSIPVALTIAASDSCSGAGVQADLKSFAACSVYGLNVVTGVVAETPVEVVSWQLSELRMIKDQLASLSRSFTIGAVKTGLLFNEEIMACVGEFCENREIPLVIDPIGTASTGTEFGASNLLDSMKQWIFPHASLVTPNLLEARRIAHTVGHSEQELAQNLSVEFGVPFLVKGGHSANREYSNDYYADATTNENFTYQSERLDVPDLHGTGCTLSAAITAYLARGYSMQDAISRAKIYLTKAMQQYYSWEVNGKTIYALNHFPVT